MRRDISHIFKKLILYVFFSFSLSLAQSNTVSPMMLHDSLGTIIDASENTRYNIFGEIAGLSAAKIYKINMNKFQLHILRNSDESAYILIINLSASDFILLQSKIAKRIEIASQENMRFEQALFPVGKFQWQGGSSPQKLILRDGSELMVTFQQAKDDTLIVKLVDGLQIPIPDINIEAGIEQSGSIRRGRFFRKDPYYSKLFLAPTGRGVEARTAYFADYYIFFPTITFGVTDFFSLSGGVSLIPGANSQLFYVSPKLTHKLSPKIGVATGFLYLAIPDVEDDVEIGYAITTLGESEASITLGAGFSLDHFSEHNFVLVVGAEKQISNSTKLITENWIFTENATLGKRPIFYSGGIRFFGNKMAIDLAFFTSKELLDFEGFSFIPWVDFSVFFTIPK